MALPDFDLHVFGVDVLHVAAAHADVGRFRRGGQRPRQGGGAVGVGGQEDLQARHCAHEGHILHGVVRAAQRAVADAAGHAQHLDVQVGIGHIHLHLFRGAGGVEARRAADEGLEPRGGQAGGDAHRVLFGDAAFHELLRQLLDEVVERDRPGGVRRQGEDGLILAGEAQKCFRDCPSCRFHAILPPSRPVPHRPVAAVPHWAHGGATPRGSLQTAAPCP